MESHFKHIETKLTKRKSENAFRELKVTENLVDFCSNDYLGFAKSQLLKNRIIDRLKSSDKLGSTGSRLISGNSSLYETVEAKIASFFEVDSALIFSSGFNLNTALLASIAEQCDIDYLLYRGDSLESYDNENEEETEEKELEVLKKIKQEGEDKLNFKDVKIKKITAESVPEKALEVIEDFEPPKELVSLLARKKEESNNFF